MALDTAELGRNLRTTLAYCLYKIGHSQTTASLSELEALAAGLPYPPPFGPLPKGFSVEQSAQAALAQAARPSALMVTCKPPEPSGGPGLEGEGGKRSTVRAGGPRLGSEDAGGQAAALGGQRGLEGGTKRARSKSCNQPIPAGSTVVEQASPSSKKPRTKSPSLAPPGGPVPNIILKRPSVSRAPTPFAHPSPAVPPSDSPEQRTRPEPTSPVTPPSFLLPALGQTEDGAYTGYSSKPAAAGDLDPRFVFPPPAPRADGEDDAGVFYPVWDTLGQAEIGPSPYQQRQQHYQQQDLRQLHEQGQQVSYGAPSGLAFYPPPTLPRHELAFAQQPPPLLPAFALRFLPPPPQQPTQVHPSLSSPYATAQQHQQPANHYSLPLGAPYHFPLVGGGMTAGTYGLPSADQQQTQPQDMYYPAPQQQDFQSAGAHGVDPGHA